MIIFDATTNSGSKDDATTYNWSHTCAVGTTLLTVSVVTFDAASAMTVSGVTYNGVGMTEDIEATANEGAAAKRRVTAVYSLVNPTAGANTVEVTLSGQADATMAVAFSFKGVTTTSPLDDTDSDTTSTQQTTASISLTAEKNNSLVVDSFIADDPDIANPSTPTRTGYVEISNATEGECMGASYTIGDAIGATTYQYSSVGSDYTCYSGALYNPAPVGNRGYIIG